MTLKSDLKKASFETEEGTKKRKKFVFVNGKTKAITFSALKKICEENMLIEEALATQQELNSLYDKQKARARVWSELTDALSELEQEETK